MLPLRFRIWEKIHEIGSNNDEDEDDDDLSTMKSRTVGKLFA